MLNGRIRFGDFEADIASGQLRRGGTLVPIQDLPFRLLTALLERPGEVVSRAELATALWGADTFVDAAAGLNTAVAKLRESLGDDADQPRLIETVPKRGYRFMGSIEPTDDKRTAEVLTERKTSALGDRSAKAFALRSTWFVALVSILVALVALAAYQLRADRSRVRVAVILFDNETGRPEMGRFAQGLTDAVVTELAAQPALAVIGNAAVLRTERPFRDIARVRDAVNADYIVIGQVQSRDDGTIVRAHLIRAKDESHVWVGVAQLSAAGEAGLQADVAGRVRTAVEQKALAR
ncbi:MAG TPA: winged helix-turn-helix domain-containing protein [Vicinamibacterales bacterium]|jgi:DNA-binding winged helix-turn-helix (wHTH) protein/TolB-like protein